MARPGSTLTKGGCHSEWLDDFAFMHPCVRLIPLFLLLGIPASGTGEEIPAQVNAFFENHCLECHDDTSRKGGLDLQSVTFSLATASQQDLWVRIHDRIVSGEMPPAKKTRPDGDRIAGLTAWLAPKLTEADQARREVVMRRLNREEWQNTIRDLLGIDLELKELLPPDQLAEGFDNNGGALAISAELMGRYLDAARRAVDAALVSGLRPESQTFTVDSLKEIQRYLDEGGYGYIDGRVVVYLANATQYSKISTRAHRTPEPGRYRFRFSAATHRAKEPFLFNVVASDFNKVGAIYRDLGHYEVSETPRTYEIEATLGKGFAIQFFPHGLPAYVKEPARAEVPGVGFSAVEVTGPLNEIWPPASHTRLVGDLDLTLATIEDATAILRRFIPRAFRRPVTETEVARYAGLVKARHEGGQSVEESLRTALTAVLCSPSFLFLLEEAPAVRKSLNGPEIAARLSYFLWSSQPDEALIAAASSGKLETREGRLAEVRRLLADPRAERLVHNFTGQWLRLRDINATTPDARLYPGFDEWLKVSMVRESEGFFRHLLTANLDITLCIDSDFAFLNHRLADHYHLPTEGLPWLEPVVVPLSPESPRGGILTQGAVLKVTANGTNTSPVIRGVWVLENLLGRKVPPPPPNIPGIEPDIRSATTIREQLDLHRSSASCQGCHQYIDPPGFALEGFDPVGVLRTHYRRFQVNPQHADKGWGVVVDGKPVDSSGTFASGDTFDGLASFQRLLLENPEPFARCLTEKLLTYALGRELGFSDHPGVRDIVSDTRSRGNGLRTLVEEIVASDLFLKY